MKPRLEGLYRSDYQLPLNETIVQLTDAVDELVDDLGAGGGSVPLLEVLDGDGGRGGRHFEIRGGVVSGDFWEC